MIQKSGEHIWSLLCHFPCENNDSGHISVVLVDEKHALKQLGGATIITLPDLCLCFLSGHPEVSHTNIEIVYMSRGIFHLG